MYLSLLVFTQLFSEVARSQPARPAQKQNLTRNSQSRSFKVVHFGITEKPTTDCIWLYNNAGLVSKVSEEIASENAENCRCRQPRCRLTPPPRRTSANIRINPILPETRVIVLHFCADIVWVYLHSYFCDGLRNTMDREQDHRVRDQDQWLRLNPHFRDQLPGSEKP